MTKREKLKLSDRIYWFKRNFPRGIVTICWLPFSWTWELLELLYIMFCVTDGSSSIDYPWEN